MRHLQSFGGGQSRDISNYNINCKSMHIHRLHDTIVSLAANLRSIMIRSYLKWKGIQQVGHA